MCCLRRGDTASGNDMAVLWDSWVDSRITGSTIERIIIQRHSLIYRRISLSTSNPRQPGDLPLSVLFLDLVRPILCSKRYDFKGEAKWDTVREKSSPHTFY